MPEKLIARSIVYGQWDILNKHKGHINGAESQSEVVLVLHLDLIKVLAQESNDD